MRGHEERWRYIMEREEGGRETLRLQTGQSCLVPLFRPSTKFLFPHDVFIDSSIKVYRVPNFAESGSWTTVDICQCKPLRQVDLWSCPPLPPQL